MYGVVPTFVTLLRIISQRMADACVYDFGSRSVRCGFFFADKKEGRFHDRRQSVLVDYAYRIMARFSRTWAVGTPFRMIEVQSI
jgi:hypothetical protein